MKKIIVLAVLELCAVGTWGQVYNPEHSYIDAEHTSLPVCDSKLNDGYDFAVPLGTKIYAATNGTVMEASQIDNGCGITVEIKYKDGNIGGYGWLSEVKVKPGESVTPGQVIALSGKSGNATEPKLHFTLFSPTGEKTDGMKWLDSLRDKSSNNDNSNASNKAAAEDKVGESAITAEQLQKAIALVNASTDLRDDQKERIIKDMYGRYEQSDKIAHGEYTENLHKALDAWYSNGKNWRKIPSDVWGKLTPRDQGRLKSGIDPEVSSTPEHK